MPLQLKKCLIIAHLCLCLANLCFDFGIINIEFGGDEGLKVLEHFDEWNVVDTIVEVEVFWLRFSERSVVSLALNSEGGENLALVLDLLESLDNVHL